MNIGALIVWLLAMASGAAVFILTPDVWTLALAVGIVLPMTFSLPVGVVNQPRKV